MNPIRAGLLAAIPLALIGIVFMLLRGQSLVDMIKAGSDESAGMTDRQWFYLMLGALVVMPFIFGVLAGMVYRWVGGQAIFLGLATGLAVLLTILAWTSHTPGPALKTVMNFLVALDFGLLIPLLTAA